MNNQRCRGMLGLNCKRLGLGYGGSAGMHYKDSDHLEGLSKGITLGENQNAIDVARKTTPN